MGTVNGDTVFKREFQLSMERAGNGLQSGPEQAVMHEQKIDVLLCGCGQNSRRHIHGRSDFRDAPRVFDLQTVERILPVANFPNPQVAVCVFNYFGEGRHLRYLARASGNLHERLSISGASCLDESRAPCELHKTWSTPTHLRRSSNLAARTRCRVRIAETCCPKMRTSAIA